MGENEKIKDANPRVSAFENISKINITKYSGPSVRIKSKTLT